MQKAKRKIGQQNFWQKFNDEYIHVRRDFRYEIDRKPKKVAATLEKFWRRQREKYTFAPIKTRYVVIPERKGYLDKIKINELEQNELWSVDIDFSYSFFTKIIGKVYLDNGGTTVELSISFEEVKSLGVLVLLVIMILVVWFIGLFGGELTGLGVIFFSILSLFLLWRGLYIRNKAWQKHKEILELLENFAIEEEEKLEAEWERLYGKAKNEEGKIKNSEEADEIPQANRK